MVGPGVVYGQNRGSESIGEPGLAARGAAYAGSVGPAEEAPAPGQTGSTTLAPARPAPALDDGDHDRMAHIVLEGYTPKEGAASSSRRARAWWRAS